MKRSLKKNLVNLFLKINKHKAVKETRIEIEIKPALTKVFIKQISLVLYE